MEYDRPADITVGRGRPGKSWRKEVGQRRGQAFVVVVVGDGCGGYKNALHLPESFARLSSKLCWQG